jgi:AcrR family transcriptional regulator
MLLRIHRSDTAVNRDRVDLVTERVKRQYRSEVRAAAAAETQERIRRAASELFVARGYLGTTLKDVAERAGVGERTLYDSFGGKRQLLGHTVAILTMGDEERVRMADRDAVREARAAEDPREAVRRHLEFNAALMERAGDLILVGEEAGRTDPVVQRTARRGWEAAYESFLMLGRRLADRDELTPGMDGETAADVLFALASPQVFHVLRRRRKWSAERYRDWLVSAAVQQVVAAQPKAEGNASR